MTGTIIIIKIFPINVNEDEITQDECIKNELKVTKFSSNPIKFENTTHLSTVNIYPLLKYPTMKGHKM